MITNPDTIQTKNILKLYYAEQIHWSTSAKTLTKEQGRGLRRQAFGLTAKISEEEKIYIYFLQKMWEYWKILILNKNSIFLKHTL